LDWRRLKALYSYFSKRYGGRGQKSLESLIVGTATGLQAFTGSSITTIERAAAPQARFRLQVVTGPRPVRGPPQQTFGRVLRTVRLDKFYWTRRGWSVHGSP